MSPARADRGAVGQGARRGGAPGRIRAAGRRSVRRSGYAANSLARSPWCRATCRAGSTKPDCWPRLMGLRQGRTPVGVVVGSGFERRPALLHGVAAPRLAGQPDAGRRAVEGPVRLRCAVPRLRRAASAGRAGTERGERPLAAQACRRRRRGSRTAERPAVRSGCRSYLQREVRGRSVSALFLADGARSRTLGFSEQWAAPTPRQPFRYGGAVRPAGVAAATADGDAERDRPDRPCRRAGRAEQRRLQAARRTGSTCWRSTRGPARHSTCSRRRGAVVPMARRCLPRAAARGAAGVRRRRGGAVSTRRTGWCCRTDFAGPHGPPTGSRRACRCPATRRCARCSRRRRLRRPPARWWSGASGEILALAEVDHERRSRRPSASTRAPGWNWRRCAAMPTALRVAVSHGSLGETLVDAGAGAPGGIAAGLRLARICMGGLGDVTLGTRRRAAALALVRDGRDLAAGAGLPRAASMPAGACRTARSQMRSSPSAPARPARWRARKPCSTRTRLRRRSGRGGAGAGKRTRAAAAAGGAASRRRAAWRRPGCPSCSRRRKASPAACRWSRGCWKWRCTSCTNSASRSTRVVDGMGAAPLPPPHPDFVTAMGRTNDAIIFGGRVQLYVTRPGGRGQGAGRGAAGQPLARLRPPVRRDIPRGWRRFLRHRQDAVQPGRSDRDRDRDRRQLPCRPARSGAARCLVR